MVYQPAADDAAKRHYRDGVVLQEKKRFDNAGYHFGISAECAVKHLLVEYCGVPAGDSVIRKLHFPALRAAALQAVDGRRGKTALDFLRSEYLQGWDISMRYAATGSVTEKALKKWKEHAQVAVGALM